MWKLEVEAPEAAIFYGSRSGKHEMNGSGSGSGSSKKILEAEAEAIKNSLLPHHWFYGLALALGQVSSPMSRVFWTDSYQVSSMV